VRRERENDYNKSIAYFSAADRVTRRFSAHHLAVCCVLARENEEKKDGADLGLFCGRTSPSVSILWR
jgi:hypothetical protein